MLTHSFLASLVAVGFAAMPAVADYPEKPITMMVPFQAGSPVDNGARAVHPPANQATSSSNDGSASVAAGAGPLEVRRIGLRWRTSPITARESRVRLRSIGI